ncbi:MAG: putative LPS assembly protein LptD [Candidatus Kapaibacteriota bacterium]
MKNLIISVLSLLWTVIILLTDAQTLSAQPTTRRIQTPRPTLRITTSATSILSQTKATLETSSTVLTTTANASSVASLKASPMLDSAAQARKIAADAASAAKADSLLRARSGIDTIVTFAAQDSMSYSVKGRKMRLRSNAYVKNEGQTLSAEIIELFFEQGYMRASNARDSSGRVVGIPKFVDKGETYYGAELSYNFRTKRGTISLAETKLGDGFFFGDKVKRIDESTFFLKDGCYTSCDKAHPHFYFKSPRMKVMAQDRIFADPLIVYFSDIPVFAIPFGLFVENKTGRRSGVLIPQVFFAGSVGDPNSLGIAFERLGYYWAINDTLDAEFSGSFFTKGGWLANFKGNYVFSRRFSGALDLSYGRGGFTQDTVQTENWRVGWRHNWEITPFTNVSGSINLSSGGFFRQTQLDVRQRVQQTITSQFSIRHTLDNGLPLNLNYQRNQNVATGEIGNSFTSGVNITAPLFPVRDLTRAVPALQALIPSDSWLNDINFSYGVNATASINVPADSLPGESKAARELRRRQALANPFIARITHTPSINIAPKFGYFVLQPSFSYNENWYFRRIRDRVPIYTVVKTANSTISTTSVELSDTTERGFFREYGMSASISLGTTLYGIVNPRILGLNSLRHTLRPSISFNYVPNLQNDNNLAGRYTDTSNGKRQETVYSRYALDGGATPSSLQTSIGWSLDNNFEAKIQQDTAEKVVQLMRAQVSGNVNLAATQFQWSPIGVGFSNTFADVIQFSGNASFSLYDQNTVRDGETQRLVDANRFLFEAGKGLLRLTNLGFNLNYRLSGNTANNKVQGGLQASGTAAPPDTTSPVQRADGEDASMGARFQQRLDNSYDKVDVFGDNTPGFAPLNLEWSTDFNGTFSFTPSNIANAPATISALISANLNLTLDKVWRFGTNFNLDLSTGQIVAPTLNLQRDLHCWDLSFRWQPFGVTQGYFFRVGIKTGQLKDVQLTRQDNSLFRQ